MIGDISTKAEKAKSELDDLIHQKETLENADPSKLSEQDKVLLDGIDDRIKF